MDLMICKLPFQLFAREVTELFKGK
eukprot:CCRYP_019405-RA/>CCRYP_019405-RA protein AED:0.42 eAED:0.42 QI:0/-1/0/1/-1/0/1/0/24